MMPVSSYHRSIYWTMNIFLPSPEIPRPSPSLLEMEAGELDSKTHGPERQTDQDRGPVLSLSSHVTLGS